MKKHLRIIKNDKGASAAEYALILAIVGSAVAIAALNLGSAIGGRMNNTASCLNASGATAITQACK
ncbi:Flp family type IVb pilin [Sphingomonas sp. ASV193]|uniref:Flp family type IVb pilin n=1 Tax=Sphingomonas sp. ASV193 TaxID=3144405 RepID=UPI0032E8E5EF